MANKYDSILEHIQKVDIKDLTHLTDEENVVIHPESEIKLIQQSLAKFGQFRPIVIDNDKRILAGNAVTKALTEMGRNSVYAVNYDDLPEKDKQALILVDNYTSEMNYFRNAFAEKIAMDIDIKDFDLGELSITDENISDMFKAKAGSSGGMEELENESSRGSDKLRRLGTYKDEGGAALASNQVRCPNCSIIITT